MYRRVARHALQLQRRIQHVADARILRRHLIELRLHLDRVRQLDADRLRRHQLGHLLYFGEAKVEHAAHIFHGGFGGQGAEGDNLRDLISPVLLRHVANHFAAAPRAKVDVDVGHGDAFRVQEALEE